VERLGQQPVIISPEGGSNDVLRSETIGAAEQFDAGNADSFAKRDH
jgi:hypothetical protein